jgi:hypothetical protein
MTYLKSTEQPLNVTNRHLAKLDKSSRDSNVATEFRIDIEE